MSRSGPLSSPPITWRDGQPYSETYGDVYFSRDSGIEESRHVFLKHNDLPRRWGTGGTFVIGETGFGTGLNFLVTLDCWCNTAPPEARLHYVSAEKHPLSCHDIAQALAQWPQLKRFAEALLQAYPDPSPGYHRRELLGGRVVLTLMLGDAAEMLAGLQASVDAWFLDGFAPSRNPDMWSAMLFQQIARNSHVGTTFATFTASGTVRRGLGDTGFEVEKVAGFGRKREMLRGRIKAVPSVPSVSPWFEPPTPRHDEKKALVIGAGLAGVAAAHALARRGWKISMIERSAGPARAASGNLAGIVMPRIGKDVSRDVRFYLSAFLDTVQRLDVMKQRLPDLPWHGDGVVQLLAEDAERFAGLGLPQSVSRIVDRDEAAAIAGVTVASGGLYFPQGGWLDPAAWCRALLDDATGIDVSYCTNAVDLRRQDEQWHVVDDHSRLVGAAPVVIIASAHDAVRFGQTAALPLTPVRGQLSYVRADAGSRALRAAVCYEGYVTPAYQGQHCVGATYHRDDESVTLRDSDHRRNLSALEKHVPGLGGFACAETSGRVAFRTTSRDHLPVVGAVPDEAFYHSRYGDLRHGRPARHYPPAAYLPGLFISVAHGSRGLVSCYPAAEIIAAQIEGEPVMLPRDLLEALHPARFLVRSLRRG